MAQQALPPGASRGRAVFGLLDADGWSWATLKALFWFLVIIFMLGYVPNLAYYFTVLNTVDVGYDFLSFVNWCPADNEDLPCPAPVGALLPWQKSPPELAMPSPRTGSMAFQSGSNVYVIGGTTDEGVTDQVLSTVVTATGNFSEWAEGPALPTPRTDAALVSYLGVPYIIGGLNARGEPTDTVYVGTVEEGKLTGWQPSDGSAGTVDLTLPRPLSGASAVATTNGIVVMGGRSGGGPIRDVLGSFIPPDGSTTLQPWEQLGPLALPEARADAFGVIVGESAYLVGGLGPDGPESSVYRISFEDGEPEVDPQTGEPLGWQVAPADEELPAPRVDPSGFTANGAIYVIGGFDAEGIPQDTTLWSVTDPTTGDIPNGWDSLDQMDLPAPRADAPVAAVGSTAFVFAGHGPDGPTDTSLRAGLSPKPPYFRLGLFGLTIPALSIKGQIGQELGYINAFTVGMIDFVILAGIGYAFSHREGTLLLIARLSRGRLKPPSAPEYPSP